MIELRAVSEADSSLVLSWRNDQETRRASCNDRIISWEEHEAWFRKGLKSPDRIMKIAEVDRQPVGVVRADRIVEGWELSWTVAPGSRKRGIGSVMLRLFVTQLEGHLVALIHRDNLASVKIARSAGFARIEGGEARMFEMWVRDVQTLEMTLRRSRCAICSLTSIKSVAKIAAGLSQMGDKTTNCFPCGSGR